RALEPEDLVPIVDIQLKQLEDRLQARRLGLEVTGEAKAQLARAGYDPAFGARPLKRLIQRAIGDPLAVAMLEGRYTSDDTVVVDVDGPGETDPSIVLK
ncbi:MAG: ATP-dependent chaperone ClpB, partial [Acidimicrobiaceae bacterium]|nr:ATP-dependent chaperone ClpB [Acidimicrobiaceae bacterium]